MSRNPSPLQVLVAVAALAVVAAAIAWLPSDGNDLPEALEISAADASEVAAFNAGNDAAAAAIGEAPSAAAPAAAQPVALPVTQDGATPPAPAAPAAAAAPAAGDPAAAAPAGDTSTTAAPAPAAPDAPSPANDPAPEPERDGNNNNNRNNGGYISRAAQEGYDVHDFVEHTVALLGTRAMEPGQGRTGGYERVGPYEIRAYSTITGQRPVIEQAIDDVKEEAPNATGQDLERRIAQRLTELNDWKNLNRQTQENMMVLTGVTSPT